jgi:2-dehydro-3-deoxy-D-arabinonate dehydratase
MILTRHAEAEGPRWAADGFLLDAETGIGGLLALPRDGMEGRVGSSATRRRATGPLLAPIEPIQEVWAAGVTYRRSRDARKAEATDGGDVYERVYAADRPELFFKAAGWRVVGHLGSIRIRGDSGWNVPEPELTLVLNAAGEIVGYCAGNDVSSRDIEGANPLYLPQAKTYNGSCALGPGIVLGTVAEMADIEIGLEILRGDGSAFSGRTRTSEMKRALPELVSFLFRELEFPQGAFLMTGTGIVPPPGFSLVRGDVVRIAVGPLTLENRVVG